MLPPINPILVAGVNLLKIKKGANVVWLQTEIESLLNSAEPGTMAFFFILKL